MTTVERPGETETQRDDRNLTELLQELRVAAIGVQVIFGFLLSLPFYARFTALGQAQRVLYLVAVVLSAVSTALLLGPVAYHRLLFRRGQKHHLVRAANVMAIAGLATVALTVVAAVLLVVSYVEPGLTAVLVTVFTVGLFGGLWFVYPLFRRWGRTTRGSRPPVPPQPTRSREHRALPARVRPRTDEGRGDRLLAPTVGYLPAGPGHRRTLDGRSRFTGPNSSHCADPPIIR